ncbi:unnamed protein product [Protopolystoma xenopodis]|uniref:Uncharacterized protein n=1 Tax=Protopolystoma xenopodis TaxID=117903 RepID=A0A3S5CRK8_9PLAT|nr:unnamed protein product [Protopolystoma xenopodis]
MVPISILKASSVYSEHKAKLLRDIGEAINDKDASLEQVSDFDVLHLS